MKKWLCALGLITACSGASSRMTQESYDAIQTGTPVTKIESDVGRPYAIHDKGGGVEEYEYIERISMGSQLIAEQHYFLVVVDGKVMGKYIQREQAPAYDMIYQDDPNH